MDWPASDLFCMRLGQLSFTHRLLSGWSFLAITHTLLLNPFVALNGFKHTELTCLWLPVTRIKGIYHHAWWFLQFLLIYIFLFFILGLGAQRNHEKGTVGEPLHVGMHKKIWKQATNMPVGLCFGDDWWGLAHDMYSVKGRTTENSQRSQAPAAGPSPSPLGWIYGFSAFHVSAAGAFWGSPGLFSF